MTTVALDFDGVLSEYHGDFGAPPGPPYPGMLALVTELIERHKVKVVVFSARAGSAMGTRLIREWLREHGFPPLDITNIKEPEFSVMLDDRAVRFIPQLAKDPKWLAEFLCRK